ncbi:MAG: hypothetical protein KAJ52_00430, partial [Sedimentisphaerales bacterium]|nr:hypothetical protein [Sedimentisphaerales bacterium]
MAITFPKTIFRGWVLAVSFSMLFGSSLTAADRKVFPGADQQEVRGTVGPLWVHPDNPRYFTDGSGRAVYLTGSHTWDTIVDMGQTDPPQKFDFPVYLNWVKRLNHNFIRLWTWEPVTWDTASVNKQNILLTVAPQPWIRTGPGKALDGKPKFNLDKFNPVYFDRLRNRVSAADKL